jgi:ABC-type Fe3+ transport system permease subunit
LQRNRFPATGIIEFLLLMPGCVTPVLVALLAAIGISGSMGWLDYILQPLLRSSQRWSRDPSDT